MRTTATITSLGFSITARERATRTFRRIAEGSEDMADRAQRAGRSIAAGFEKLDGAMTAAGTAAGVALGASLVKAVDASAATAKLRAQLDLTAAQSQRFGQMAGRLYSQAYGESIEEVHGAIGAVVSSIDGMRNASDRAVSGMARKALTLAKVFEIDVNRSIQVVGQIVKTGLVKDANTGMDLLAAALQRVPAAVREDLLDALDEYGPFMKQIGITGARAFEILIQAADKGAFGIDKTGDAFKELTLVIASSSPDVESALQSIGLSQERVQDAFAKGGTAGQKAFQKIVSGLLKIEDPGKRAATAITLFGTPIEDIGTKDIPKFLERLLGTQTQMRNTAGAADRMGQAIQETAGTKLESFKRSVTANLTSVIANDVIPKLEKLTETAKSVGLTPSGVANAIFMLAGVAAGYKAIAFAAKIATFQVGRFSIAKGVTGGAAALGGLVTGFRNVNAAMAANATLSTRLGAALRSQIMLWRQQAAATGVSTARIIVNAAAQKVAAAATRIWAIAQGIFNAVMSANPIALVILAIVALVAAVVLAYKKSETFRNIVNAVWNGVKNAVLQAWNFIKPIFFQIVHVLRVVIGTALRWYWAYVKFVFTTVWTIIKAVWGFIKPIFMAIANVVRAVLGRAFTFFQNIAKVVWIAIQIYIKIAWTLIKGYFTAIKFYITKVLIPIFKFLWRHVIVPVWDGIKKAIGVAWRIVKGIFNAVKWYISNVLAPIFRWLWRNVIKPVWNGIKTTISVVWSKGIKPIFDKVKSAVGKVRDAFSTAVDGIKKTWTKVKGIAKRPVNFMIGLYNDGIVSLVNKIAGFAGIDTRLGEIKKFASGGVMPGYQPNGNDPLVARVNPGEAIMRPEFTRGIGAQTIHALNKLARTGGPKAIRDWFASGGERLGAEGAAFRRGGIAGGFAGRFDLGGIVGGFVKKIKDFTFSAPEKAFKAALGKIMDHVPGSGTLRDVIAAIPKKLAGWLTSWFKDKVGFGGGPGMNRAMAFAKAQAGKPYVWGGVGPGGFDCSGLLSAITNVIQGKHPYARRFTTFSFTGADRGPAGFRRGRRSGFEVGITNAGVGHMAGTLLGKPVESSGSAGVRVGGGARGAGDPLFNMRYGLKADTGAVTLAPGWNPVFNGTRRPEHLQTPRGGGDVHVYVENRGVIGSRLELQDWLARIMDDLRKQGRLPSGT